MTEENIHLKKKGKERIEINSIKDFKSTLIKEGYFINEFDEEKFKGEIIDIFQVDNIVVDAIYSYLEDNEINYRANNVRDFIDYIEKMMLFEISHKKLCEEIGRMKKITIDRMEYERELSTQDNVEDILKEIEETKIEIYRITNEEEKRKLDTLEKELDKNHVYSKDIEILKKMLVVREDDVEEKYNDKTKIKTLSIKIPKEINYKYIKVKRGSLEYHQHLTNNIPRIKRLIKNLNKYIEVDKKEKTISKIDQSKTLQDTINIAIANYDNKEFKAISGSINVKNYCTAPLLEEETFKSSKVNKLGKLGIGYNRVNDSEKKIFEEINKQIEGQALKDEGEVVLYSKWEPCPSCRYVISQFCKKYPKIKVRVGYIKGYGEK